MRVLTYVEPGKLEWREAPDPEVRGAGEAVVRPVAASPCDLDKAIIAGRTPLPGPFALGHEAVAEVVAVGDGVTRLAVGQLVVVPWHICCGACDRCLAGLTASCRAVTPRAMYGTPIGGAWGGLFSDLVHVPFAEAMLVPVPAGVPAATVAAASDNLTDAWVAVSRPLAQHPGARVLVVGGAGSIGLYAVQLAFAAGASGVDYVDRSEGRLALAAAFGATPIQRSDADLPEHDVVVDASANHAELVRAIRAVGPGGVCTSVGIYFLDAPLPLLDMYAKDVTFRTGRCSVGPHIPRVLSLVASGAVHPERVTSDEAPWDSAVDVLLGRKLKPVLVRPQIHAAPASALPPE
jgi:threonine dehydrogenase-like Zn-dependent dehydrogenase